MTDLCVLFCLSICTDEYYKMCNMFDLNKHLYFCYIKLFNETICLYIYCILF